MPVPKRKRSRARRDSRFAHKGMVMHAITACKNCDKPLLPHAACHNCGFYKGAKVMKTKVDRSLNRMKAKQVKATAKNKKRPGQSEPAQ
jgi:large subunit ribosomal protein L32